MDEFLPFLKTLLYIIIGAVGASLPLYYKIRKLNLDISKQTMQVQVQKKIDSEAEWGRIIEARIAVHTAAEIAHQKEITALKAKDEDQEKELEKLREDHTICRETEARNNERIKMAEETIRRLQAELIEVKALLYRRRRNKPKEEKTDGDGRVQPTG